MAKITFNFHGLVGFELNTDDPSAQDFFLHEYAYSRGEISPSMKVVRLHWNRGQQSGDRGETMISHTHKGLARWKYAISIDDEMIDIVASGNHFALPMVHHMMVHPSLRFLVSMNQTILLHGAAVATGTHSFVFSGPGGMGKTTLSSLMLAERGDVWNLHADDYVFLHRDGHSFAYLTRSHLYRDLLRWLPEMRSRLTLPEQLRIEILGHIRKLSRENIKWPVRLSQERLWPGHGISHEATLAGLCILSRGEGIEPELIRFTPGPEDITALLDMNFYEARHFITLMSKAFGASRTDEIVEAWRKREEQILCQLHEASSFFSLALPGLTQHTKGIGDTVTRILLDREK